MQVQILLPALDWFELRNDGKVIKMRGQKEPFDRLMLKQMKPENYIKKLESVIIDEGKSLLNSLKTSYRIIRNKDIGKWLEKHPEFKKVYWKQIGIHKLLEDNAITRQQYHLLITMKQVLNKNNNYLLRGDQFDLRNNVLNCSTYKLAKELCYQHTCPSRFVCPKHYINDFGQLSEKISKGRTKRETEHLLHCKSNHYNTTLSSDADYEQKEMLVCGRTGQFVDLEELKGEVSRLLERRKLE